MEEIKIKRKPARSILRMPEWRDLPIGGALFLISRASLLGTFAPGVAFFAAVCDMSAAYIYLPVLLLGSLSAGADPFKYFFAALAFWLISEFRLRDAHRLTNSFYCGCLIVITGLISALGSQNPASAIFLLLIEGIFSGVMYYAFFNTRLFLTKSLHPRHITGEETVSFILFICSVISGLSGIILPLDINIAQIVGIYLILCTVTYLPLSYAVCFAAAVGFASVAATAEAIVMIGIMSTAAAFASLLKQYGKYAVVTGFLAGLAVSILYLADSYTLPVSVIPVLFSAAMFLVTPPVLHAKLNAFFMNTFDTGSPEGELKIKKYISLELKNVSRAFSKLSARLLTTSDALPYNSRATSSTLFEEVTSRICADCPSSDECWRKNLNETCKYMFSIIDIMETEGYCDMTNIPIVFSQKCKRRESFIAEFNHAYEMCKQSSLFKNEASAGRDLMAHQYSEIASVINDLSGEVEFGFYFKKDIEDSLYHIFLEEKIPLVEIKVIADAKHQPEVYIISPQRIGKERLRKLVSSAMNFPMRLVDDYAEGYHLVADNLYYPEISIKQKKQEGQNVSGDCALHFEAPNNKYCILLCDGMGSGDEAYAESHMCAELLREFILAGVKTETAIRIINSSLALKTGREGFSTVDLLEIDLISGSAELYKIGGAQSYLRIRDDFKTVTSRSLPLGIVEDITPNRTSYSLHNGDMAVLVSDGIAEADFGAMRGEWIKKIMSEELPCDGISTLIINDALKKTFPNPPDDMTAVVVKLCKY